MFNEVLAIKDGENRVDFFKRVRDEYVKGNKTVATNTIYADETVMKTVNQKLAIHYPTYMNPLTNSSTFMTPDDFRQAVWLYIIRQIPNYTGLDAKNNKPLEFQTFCVRHIQHAMAEAIASIKGTTRSKSEADRIIENMEKELVAQGKHPSEITDADIYELAKQKYGKDDKKSFSIKVIKNRREERMAYSQTTIDENKTSDMYSPEKRFFQNEQQEKVSRIMAFVSPLSRLVLEHMADCSGLINAKDDESKKLLAEKQENFASDPELIELMITNGLSQHIVDGKVDFGYIKNTLQPKARNEARRAPSAREDVVEHQNNKSMKYGEILNLTNEADAIDTVAILDGIDDAC